MELGGDDLKRKSRMLDREGQEVPGSRGYKYFGAARELPGVRELFENEAIIHNSGWRPGRVSAWSQDFLQRP